MLLMTAELYQVKSRMGHMCVSARLVCIVYIYRKNLHDLVILLDAICSQGKCNLCIKCAW